MAPSLLKIIETSQVSPPADSVPETSIPSTFFDLMWLNFAPAEGLFFYSFQHSTSHFTSSCLPSLKSSLSLALQSFFPLAGNIRLAPETTNKYEIHYVDGDSVVFTVVESDHYDELFGDHPREISKLRALMPCLRKNESNGQQPVSSIQVTVFPPHGLTIGTSVHHSACDGSSSVNFMCTWATICRMSNSMEIPTPTPVRDVEFDRSIITDPGSIYTALFNDMLSSTNLNLNTSQPNHEMFIASYKLNREHIQLLQKVLLHEGLFFVRLSSDLIWVVRFILLLCVAII